MLPVSEIFQTIQGEGVHAGQPSCFVRLQGCDVGCPWCDTKHSWDLAATDATYTALDLVQLLVEKHALVKNQLITITGGEPCTYNLGAFTTKLLDEAFQVQIETSGTYPVVADDRCWVTVSPKIGMPGGRELDAGAIERADELKVVVGKAIDVERGVQLWNLRKRSIPLSFQPMSLSESSTRMCVEAAKVYGARLSLQTHKYIGIE